MSAETLRKAASLMRERACSGSLAAPWTADVRQDGRAWVRGANPPYDLSMHGFGDDAEHIASWHPAVALAVADWLDIEAARWQQVYDDTQAPSHGIDQPPAVNHGNPTAARENADHHCRSAINVARAYLVDHDA